MTLERIGDLVGDAAGAVARPIQHRAARIADRLDHVLRPAADLMHPAVRPSGLVDHRVAGIAERAISAIAGAVAGDADPVRGGAGHLAGAIAEIAGEIGHAPAGRLDALVAGDAVHRVGVAGDQPSRANADQRHRDRVGAHHFEAAVQPVIFTKSVLEHV